MTVQRGNVEVDVEVDDREIQALVDGPIADDAQRRGQAVAGAARRRVRVDTGELLGSISAEAGDDGTHPVADIRADALAPDGFPYGVAVEFGAAHMTEDPFLRPALEEINDG